MIDPIIVTERSENAKLTKWGNVSATMAPQQTCPTDCPLLKHGCYAESGCVGVHTHRLNARAGRLKQTLGALRLTLARIEAAAIRKLTGKLQLRVHVVGDCATAAAAKIVGGAMVRHQERHGKAAWTYTHAWRTVPLSAWQGAAVLASCESPAEAREALARGYAVALITPEHPSNKIYDYGGLTVVPCPAQFKGKDGERVVTCENCNLCKRPDRLWALDLVVGFQPDRGTGRKVIPLLPRQIEQERP